jgi:phenylalanyl-tRNA synthetase beta chain
MDIEGAHDLVEEVCRMYGYDRLPSTIMEDGLPPQRGNRSLEVEEQIKDSLVQLGLQEIITYRLTTPEREGKVIPRTAELPPDDRPYVTLANPITVDRIAMRHSLLASVLEVVADNSRFRRRIALFESGHVYLGSEEGQLPDEQRRLVIAIMGPRRPEYWDADAPAHLDFYDLKGIVEGLLERLHVEEYEVKAHNHPSYRPGRSARLMVADSQVAVMGELHPLVRESFEVRGDAPVLAAEINLEMLLPLVPEARHVDAIASYPPVQEDLALLVDAGVPAAAVEDVIRRTGGFLLSDVTLFDVYEGERIPAGKKSLAYHLTFQAPNRTLTDKDVSRQRQRILRAAEKEVGAKLRE